jgi:hypothetical protein
MDNMPDLASCRGRDIHSNIGLNPQQRLAIDSNSKGDNFGKASHHFDSPLFCLFRIDILPAIVRVSRGLSASEVANQIDATTTP